MKPRDWPIERKFIAGTVGITLAAIILVSVLLIASEVRAVRRERVASTYALLGLIANNAAAALLFEDQEVARQIVNGSSADPSTRAAALYNANGELYASFVPSGRDEQLPARVSDLNAIFTRDYLEAVGKVMSADKFVGYALLRTDLAAMRERFRGYLLTVAGCAAGAVSLAFLLAHLLHKWIAEPLHSLSRTAKAITANRNYSLRASKSSSDEIGELVDSFNRMVGEVEHSHQRIQAHSDHLEKVVTERTARLTETVAELETFSYSISHDLQAP